MYGLHQVELAEKCLWNAEDLSGLLLLYSSLGSADGFRKLAEKAKEKST
jgi:coatomer subunit beta'